MISDIANMLCFHPNELSNAKTKISEAEVLKALKQLKSVGILIDKDQEKAIIHSFLFVLTLLWGPAGTGKTDTVANYLTARILLSDKLGAVNIVIGSNNYSAIDNLLAKVYTKVNKISSTLDTKFYRVKSISAVDFVDPEVPSGKIHELTRSQKEKAVGMIEDIEDKNKNCIIAGTWQQITKIASERVEWFDICVLDEATQLNTIAALAYFTMLKNNANVTIAGDYRQLGTIYAYDNQLEDSIYDSIFNYYRNDHAVQMQKLNKTYRSNEHVASWPRERFYENVYDAFYKDKRPSYSLNYVGKPPEWPDTLLWHDSFLQIIDPNNPIVVIVHDESFSTLSNHFESDLILALNYLLWLSYDTNEEEYWENYVGIVTPHRAQNSLIKNKLIQYGFVKQNGPIAVNTVDSFQGKQRQAILNSYVVSDLDFIQQEEEFILDSRRFNVTLTRAESKFIMIISSSLLKYLSDNYEVAKDASHLQLFAKTYCSKTLSNMTIDYQLKDGGTYKIKCKIRIP